MNDGFANARINSGTKASISYNGITRIPSGIWSRLYGCASRWAAINNGAHDGLLLIACTYTTIGPPTHFFCHGQKRDNLIRASQRARGATKNVVKIGSVISEFKKRDCEIYASIGPQFEDSHSLRTLTFQNGLHYHNFDFSRLISSHFCTSHRNLARFS